MNVVTICSYFGAQKNKVSHCFHCFPIYLSWSDGTRCHDLVFWMLSFKPASSLSSFTLIKRLLSSSSISAIRVVSSVYVTFRSHQISHSVVSDSCDPTDCSPPGSSGHGIFQARILESVAISFSRGSSWLRDWTLVSCIGKWILLPQRHLESPAGAGAWL